MNQSLHLKLTELVRRERNITGEILELINQIEVRMIHLSLGYSSMFEYLTKGMGYSEGSAQRRLQSARLLKQTPQIADKLQSGHLNLTQVALVQSALRQQAKIKSIAAGQKEELLEKIEGQTQLQTRRILQETFPDVKLNSEKIAVRPKGKTIISFEVSEDELKLIEMAKALLSHTCPTQQTKEVLLKLCEKLIKSKISARTSANESAGLNVSVSNNESESASLSVSVSNNESESETSKPTSDLNAAQVRKARKSSYTLSSNQHSQSLKPIEKTRGPIPVTLRRDLFRKANQQCEYKSSITQKRCEGRNFLEIDHIKPVALGGKSNAENLRVLCREHNKHAAGQAGVSLRYSP